MPIKSLQTTLQLDMDTIAYRGNRYSMVDSDNIQLCYENRRGKLYNGESISWMRQLQSASVDLIFADPPYNVKKADWDYFDSDEQYLTWSHAWISEAARLLKPTGTIYICGYSEILANILVSVMPMFKGCRWLIWHYKNKANLGNDWGRSHESIIHLRKEKKIVLNIDNIRIPYGAHTLKYPEHPQSDTSQYSNNGKTTNHWKPNSLGAKPKDVFDIPTTCNGMGEKTPHPTQKPEELLRKLVLASSNVDDLILDPFSGSGTTAVVAEQLERNWLACDNNLQYNEWAINRIEHVEKHSIQEWIQFDIETARRRESIR